jgi:predicted RNA-binding Zn-ribbon protein involved in translation (DUF1610 family)
MRTASSIKRKPVQACAVCGASLHGSTVTACPSCGASLDDVRAYRDNLGGYAVETSPPHKWSAPEAHRVA